MQLKIKGWIINFSIEKAILLDKPIQEEYFDNPCRYCKKKITSLDAYSMAKYGVPHCDAAQNPELRVK